MSINKDVINEIAQKNPTAEAFFEYLTKRERNARNKESSIKTIKQHMAAKGYNAEPQELLFTLRELDRVGAIELKGDRFLWRVGIRDLVGNSSPIIKRHSTETKLLAVCFDNHRQFKAHLPSFMNKEELKLVYKMLAESNG